VSVVEGLNLSEAGTSSDEAEFRRLLESAISSDTVQAEARETGLTDADLRGAISREGAHAAAEREAVRLTESRRELARAKSEVATEFAAQRPGRSFVTRVLLRLPGSKLEARFAAAETERRKALERRYGIASLSAAVDNSRQRYEAAVYELGIVPALLRYIRERSEASWSTTLTTTGASDAPGLAEIVGVEPVPTQASERLSALMRGMPCGSIGISGLRGVGKTTLIAKVARSRSDDQGPGVIGLRVSAPTKYDGRDFVLYLFGCLCDEVERLAGYVFRPELLSGLSWFVLARALGVALATASLGLVLGSALGAVIDIRFVLGLVCVAAAVLALLSGRAFALEVGQLRAMRVAAAGVGASAKPEPYDAYPTRLVSRGVLLVASVLLVAGAGLIVVSQLAQSTPAWFWGALGLLGAVVLIAGLPELTRISVGGVEISSPGADSDIYGFGGAARSQERMNLLVPKAREYAEMIRYQRTVSTSWTATAKLPVADLGTGGGRSLQQMPMGFPELMAKLGDFISLLVPHARVVIGIDELDKIESDATANQFLNEIKGVFGITGCFFLVSVSEEALSNFARRDTRIRDVFDSSFDEIIDVRPPTLEESRRILAGRRDCPPVPFQALCHTLSGGLPRDLIRLTRTLVSLRAQNQEIGLQQAAQSLIEVEVAARRRAGIIAARSLSLEPHTSAFLDWLELLEKAGSAILKAGMQDRGWADCGRDGDDRVAQEAALLNSFVREMRTYAYFADTVLRFFSDDLRRERLESALESAPPHQCSLDVLAQARHAFGWNLSMAWSQVTLFRRAWDIDVIDSDALVDLDGQTIAPPERPAAATVKLP
jgi:hypothetical protein